MSCPHTQFRKGQRIHIILKSGSSFVDIYRDTKSGVIVVEGAGRVQIEDIRACSIYRETRREGMSY